MNKKTISLAAASIVIALCIGFMIVKLTFNSHEDEAKEPPKISKPSIQEYEVIEETAIGEKENPLFGLYSNDTSPVDDLRIIDSLFFHYYSVFKEIPLGTHEEMVSAFLGNNPKKIQYIKPNNPALNEEGQLVDRWRTPLFLHAISHQEIEIISAGPDKTMWSEDDIRYQSGQTKVDPLVSK